MADWCRGCRCYVEGDLYRGYCEHCWEQWKEARTSSSQQTGAPDGRSYFRITKLPVGELQFSQATISGSFRNGASLSETESMLRMNPDLVHKIPFISVVRDAGRLVSMDNRRLYTFRMAFDDDHQVPIKLFDSKEDFGVDEFHRKATSICGGHLVEVRDESTEKDGFPLPRNAKTLVSRSWQEVRSSMGARLYFQGNEVQLCGSRRQVEEGIRHVQRILSTYDCCTVDLHDYRAKEAVKRASVEWRRRYPTLSVEFDAEQERHYAHIGGNAGEVKSAEALAKALVDETARVWEEVRLPSQSGPYFRHLLPRRLTGKLHVDERQDLLRICGTAGERRQMMTELEELKRDVSTKQLQVDDSSLRWMLKKGANLKELCRNTSVRVTVGDDTDTQVHVTGDSAEVKQVMERLRAFLQENKKVTKTFDLLPGSTRFVLGRLKRIRSDSEAKLYVPKDGDQVCIQGNQRQVDFAEELLQQVLFVEYGSIILKISSQLVGEIVGKNGVVIQSIKSAREVDIQFEPANGGWVTSQISGKKEDCTAASAEIIQRLQNYELVSLQISSSLVGLVIGKGGANIKAFKCGLQIREDTQSNPWIISGPRDDVEEFLRRLQKKFSVPVLGGLDTYRFACPDCGEDFPEERCVLKHIRQRACRACSCAGECGAYYADKASCQKHEAWCPLVKRCPGCHAAFPSEAELAKHVSRKACKARSCRGCRKIFTDIPAAELHQQSCEQYAEKMRDVEVRRHILQLKETLCSTCRFGEQKGSSCSTCKALLRRAQLKWHPDKNPDNEIIATIVFRFVQAVWDGSPQWLPATDTSDETFQAASKDARKPASSKEPEQAFRPAQRPECTVQ
ncbi:Vigilin [Symbiodinium microadriaticum]|uniref:Vigilin n=1 Tax=Symbiodinium microadriaticum TaxID=2951 RepID=A0A1Q9ENL7_SYMMI|nr:Vigilin [Symbiodinium microadriaticum]CAE7443361.1 Hdlbp [Symbiodinium sp. KB8]